MAIVYRHRRNDTNEVFYIGIGREEKRAYSIYKRNTHWNGIVNLYGHTIEIIATDLTWEDACELEIFLISEYGRRDLGTGPLVNMTDGGEGVIGVILSDESRKKISDSNKGKKLSNDTKNKIGELSKLKKNMLGKKHSEETKKKIGEKSIGRKIPGKIVLDMETGIYYDSISEASLSTKWSRGYLKQMLTTHNNKTNLKIV